jgi:hypothetical protein
MNNTAKCSGVTRLLGGVVVGATILGCSTSNATEDRVGPDGGMDEGAGGSVVGTGGTGVAGAGNRGGLAGTGGMSGNASGGRGAGGVLAEAGPGASDCPAPDYYLVYEMPGCDGTVERVCIKAPAENGDAGVSSACSCDGRVIWGSRGYIKPYRYVGDCKDGGGSFGDSGVDVD